MANALFDFWKEELHDAAYNIISETLKLDLLDTAVDNPDVTLDDFYDDIAGGVGSTATLGSKSNTTPGNGALDAADGTWPSVAGTVSYEETLGWVDTAGAAATDPLVFSMDTFSSGMPVTSNGGDINFSFNASGIFSY